MATEEKAILQVDIEGLNTLNDFKKALADIRKAKGDLNVASEEYKTLAQQETQVIEKQKAALGKTKTEVVAAEGSFDALNQKLAELKKQWKATGDEMERAQLTEQINEVKGELNAMNESIGNFQHNVGNYAGAMREVFGGAIGSVVGNLQKVNSTLKLLYTNPIVALVAGLAAVIMGIVKAIKSSEDAMQRVNVLLAPMKVLSDAVLNVLQNLAGKLLSVFEGVGKWLGKMLDRLSEGNPKLAEWNEKLKEGVAIQKEANALEKESRENAVKNARDQLKISELRAKANDKEKYSAQERLAFIREANRLELAISKRNQEEAERRLAVMLEEAERAENNAETNEKIAQQQIAVYNAQKDYHNKSRELLGQENALLAEIQNNAQKVTAIIDKGFQEAEKARQRQFDSARKAAHDQVKLQADTAMRELELMLEQDEAEFDILREGWEREKALEEEKKRTKKAILMETLNATSSILGSIAELYESSGKADAKAQTKAKNLRIAGATIDMLGGIVSAWASAFSPTNSGLTSFGQIAMATLTSSTILATGLANIAKIKSTDTSGSSAPVGVGASVYAPAVIQQVPVTRSLTGASEEERLNQIAQNTGKDQRVYLVYSDVEAAGNRVAVQNAETSF